MKNIWIKIIKAVLLLSILELCCLSVLCYDYYQRQHEPIKGPCYILDYFNAKIWLSKQHVIEGKASWYGNEFNGRKTANGEIFHETIPSVAIANTKWMGYNCFVEVNEKIYGPYHINDTGAFGYKYNRVADFSKSAFSDFCHPDSGVVKVKLYPF